MKSKKITQAALLAAAYAALAHFQNLLLPGSGSWAIQFRAAEALCVLAFFTPVAIPGLTVGCMIFDLTAGLALPLDFLAGSGATALATTAMWLCRKHPLPGLLMPAVFNGLLIGWELAFHMGSGFWVSAGYVALGEALVMFLLGQPLYQIIKRRKLNRYL